MFDNITYESILERMLGRISDNFDKRESSPIYTILAPVAMELQEAYIALDMVSNEGYADTASYYYLAKRAAERRVYPEEAKNAIIKGVFNIEVPLSTRFNLGEVNYYVHEKINNYSYKLVCETAGEVGNQTGTLLPLEYVEGLETAEATEILIAGEDDESLEDFRLDYYASFNDSRYSLNKVGYQKLANSMPGVTGSRVLPVWNGNNTVKLIVLGLDKKAASDETVSKAQETIDPNQDGMGDGLAGIGHIVTVVSAEEVTINVLTTIEMVQDVRYEDIESYVIEAIENYFIELRDNWENETSTTIRVSKIESAILTVDGVLDVSNTTINDGTANIELNINEVPVLGGVTKVE